MRTVIVLHGWGSCSKNWSWVKELLENQGYKVFVPDLPGFGENPPPSQPWSVDDYSDWVKKYIEKLSQIHSESIEPFFLLGHSFGGGVAIKFALKYPQKVKKLFLVSTAAVRRKTIKKEILKRASNLFNKFSFLPFYSFFRRVFYQFIIRKSDYLYSQGIMRETYLKVINEDLLNYSSQISLPTVIIWGRNDKITPLKDAYLINKEIKNSKLEIIEGAKHALNLETPEILAEKILNFIKL